MDIEAQVARHYTHGSLEKAILDALSASGKDINKLQPADLSAADEFHLGWRAETIEFAEQLGLSPDMRVIDIGAGIGGPARYFAQSHGCRVTGVDLTQEFVAVANSLSHRCGLGDRVDFQQASGLALPFENASFDVATLIHVGMNIADKAKLFSEARRVLRPGGRFGVYDITSKDASVLPYPMLWSATEETSFVEPVETYRALLEQAGFAIEKERDRSGFCLALWRKMREKMAAEGAPTLSLQVLVGPAGKERFTNVITSLERGLIAPVEIVAAAV